MTAATHAADGSEPVGIAGNTASTPARCGDSHGRHARLAADVLRRMGASRMADVVAEAAASHEHAFAGWAARRAELDALGELAVVKPYAGLSNADDLVRLTDQYRQAVDDEDRGSRLEAYLSDQVRLLTA